MPGSILDSVMTTDVREREDLSDVVDTLLLNSDDMKFLSFVRNLGSIREVFGEGVQAQKHEWFDDEARPVNLAAIASGGAADWDDAADALALPVVTAEIVKLRIGDMLLLPDAAGEVVVVSVINVAAQTIDVVARGHGSTVAAAQGIGALDIQIIGNAQNEDSDPIDPNYIAPSEVYNYTQITEDVAGVSGTVRRSKTVAGDVHDMSIVKKLKECLRILNRTLYEGIRNKTGNRATMGGIREFLTGTSNVGGALTIAKFYTVLVAHIDAGLFPHAIHGSAGVIAVIEQLFNTGVRTKTSEKRGGQSINVISAMNYEIELHVDRDMRSGEFVILDYNRIAYGPLEGGKHEDGNFREYELLKHGKEIKTQVLGEHTIRVSNGGATKAYGIS